MRLVDVDEVLLRRSVELALRLDQLRSLSVEPHLRCGVVAVPHPIARLSKRWYLVPTGPQAARPGYAVTLALRPHVVGNSLQHTQ